MTWEEQARTHILKHLPTLTPQMIQKVYTERLDYQWGPSLCMICNHYTPKGELTGYCKTEGAPYPEFLCEKFFLCADLEACEYRVAVSTPDPDN